MQHQTTLHISSPCGEDWNGMVPTKEGKFCSACSKQVIDFSMMTDQQILTLLSKQSSHLCGRFEKDQLNRALLETKMSKKKSLWLAITLPFMLMFQKSFGQKHDYHKGNKIVRTEYKSDVVGAISIVAPIPEPVKTKLVIQGMITDENDKPIPYATIMNEGTNEYASSDSSGHFSIEIIYTDSVTLTASYVGFALAEKQIGENDLDKPVTIVMNPQTKMLREVVVTDYLSRTLHETMGGIAICRSVTTSEKIDSSFKKIMGVNLFTVYPNPAARGSIIHINIKKEGNYELQLLDNNSVLIKSTTAYEQTDNGVISFLIPDNISAGLYYLRLIDEKKRKSDLEKIIIQ